ncbi:NUDIX hydrolase [Pseudooceanicola sp. HF7]|nr:NUDIX hydrolase [Pseudooceanicola sp. HF7]
MNRSRQKGNGTLGIQLRAWGAPKAAQREKIFDQYAALTYRMDRDKPRILVITSRGTGRWILPKGWPMKSLPPAEAALREAYEEAGVTGQVATTPIGCFPYDKVLDDGAVIPCLCHVFAVRLDHLETEYPEAGQRRRKWVSRKKAARLVDEPELARILLAFDPETLVF